MDWIKRNLYFLVGGAVALALMGMAGWFLYSKYQLNNAEMEKLNQDYATLGQLNSQDPHPGAGNIDNIKLARQQQEEVKLLMDRAREKFQPIPPIPDLPEITDRDFSVALSRTLYYLQRAATNASVVLPPNYLFSFSAHKGRVTFAKDSLRPLAVQLGEVKAICEVLFNAKVNSLDNLRRERVSTDDNTGQLSDYFDKKSITNELAVLSHYEVSFRTFSQELAAILSGFSSSPHGIIVKAINVELAPAQTLEESMPVTPTYMYVPTTGANPAAEASAASQEARFRARYGLGGGRGAGRYGPTPAQQPVQQPTYAQPMMAAPAKTGPQTVLNERQLKVTLALTVVKLKSQPTEPQPAQ